MKIRELIDLIITITAGVIAVTALLIAIFAMRIL